jgi:hypothetical protein
MILIVSVALIPLPGNALGNRHPRKSCDPEAPLYAVKHPEPARSQSKGLSKDATFCARVSLLSDTLTTCECPREKN